MKLSRILRGLASGVLALALSHPALAIDTFAEDYEDLPVASGGSELADLGWQVFANVFDGTAPFPGNQKFNFGPFVAPNGGPSFSSVATGDATSGGTGVNYLNIYSDYNCCDLGLAPGSQQGHGDGVTVDIVHALVFKEFEIQTTDIGRTVIFTFDAKRPEFVDIGFGQDGSAAVGNACNGVCTANAFIKTLDPDSGFAQTNYITEDMTSISQSSWTTYTMTIDLTDPLLDGQLLQIGFENFAGEFDNTGVYYDNISVSASEANIPIPGFALAVLGVALGWAGIRAANRRQ